MCNFVLCEMSIYFIYFFNLNDTCLQEMALYPCHENFEHVSLYRRHNNSEHVAFYHNTKQF